MSSSHGLSDEQVSNELKRMIAFIKQEAVEKSREIHIKVHTTKFLQHTNPQAEEEFAIEKAKLVRQETSQIDAQYESKYKQASMAQQIAASNISNKSRLRILNSRQQVLDSIFEDARQKLPEIQKDKEKYAKLLKNLILQVMIAQFYADIRDYMR
jgi:V-type H+-transporting ATPase subunit E